MEAPTKEILSAAAFRSLIKKISRRFQIQNAFLMLLIGKIAIVQLSH